MEKLAHFVVLNDFGKTGKIVLGNGLELEEVFTKTSARTLAYEARAEGLIPDEQMYSLIEEINSSSLARDHAELQEHIRKAHAKIFSETMYIDPDDLGDDFWTDDGKTGVVH